MLGWCACVYNVSIQQRIFHSTKAVASIQIVCFQHHRLRIYDVVMVPSCYYCKIVDTVPWNHYDIKIFKQRYWNLTKYCAPWRNQSETTYPSGFFTLQTELSRLGLVLADLSFPLPTLSVLCERWWVEDWRWYNKIYSSFFDTEFMVYNTSSMYLWSVDINIYVVCNVIGFKYLNRHAVLSRRQLSP